MHAFIWPNYMDEFKDNFQEGKIYSIKNFSVKTYRKESLRCTRNDKQIWFSNYTKVFQIEDNKKSDKMIRNIKFDFFDIADIQDIVKHPDNNHIIGIDKFYTIVLLKFGNLYMGPKNYEKLIF